MIDVATIDAAETERALVQGPGGLFRFLRLAWRHAEVPGSPPFVDNWTVRALCRICEEISNGERARTVVNLPPSSGKSIITGIFWPAWTWITQPRKRWMFVSYDSQLPNRDARSMLALMQSPWFVSRFGQAIPGGPVKISEVRFVGGGVRFNASLRGMATGQHCNIQVVDDPNKAVDALDPKSGAFERAWGAISGTFASRRSSSDFSRLIMAQRLATADVSGLAIEEGWERIRFPMRYVSEGAHPYDARTEEGAPLFPARFPASALDEIQRSVGPAAWAAQYQQDPELQGGGIFNPLWFGPQVEINADQVPFGAATAQSWDLTFKGEADSDWVAGGAWAYHREIFYLRAIPFFERADFVETLHQINARIRAPGWDSAAILIEAKANGNAVESVIKKELPGLIEMVEPEGSKTARANAITPILSSGRIRLVRGPHLDRWRQTFPRFPALKRDDEIDQMTQAIRWLAKRGGYWEAIRAISRS